MRLNWQRTYYKLCAAGSYGEVVSCVCADLLQHTLNAVTVKLLQPFLSPHSFQIPMSVTKVWGLPLFYNLPHLTIHTDIIYTYSMRDSSQRTVGSQWNVQKISQIWESLTSNFFLENASLRKLKKMKYGPSRLMSVRIIFTVKNRIHLE